MLSESCHRARENGDNFFVVPINWQAGYIPIEKHFKSTFLLRASIMDGENWFNYAFSAFSVGTSTIFLYFSFFLGSLGEHAIKSGDSPCKRGSSDCSVKGASDEHTSLEDEKVKQPESFCIF